MNWKIEPGYELGLRLVDMQGEISGDIGSHSHFSWTRLVIIPCMDNSQLDIRKYDWFEHFRDSLDDEDRKELDAFASRVNEHRAAIAVAGYDFPEYVVMLSFMMEEHKDLNRLQRGIAE